jgi:uncharacterized protein YeaO (DUF488 family)
MQKPDSKTSGFGGISVGNIKIKRIYDEISEDDGFRVLLDRLWPRGINKEKAQLDNWAKEIAPSNELRKEYHENQDLESFKIKYGLELEANSAALDFKKLISTMIKDSNVTFLTSAKNMDYNHCHALKDWIE